MQKNQTTQIIKEFVGGFLIGFVGSLVISATVATAAVLLNKISTPKED